MVTSGSGSPIRRMAFGMGVACVHVYRFPDFHTNDTQTAVPLNF